VQLGVHDERFLAPSLFGLPGGVGLMMWMMMRGHSDKDSTGQGGHSADRSEVDALRAEIEVLKAQRAAEQVDDRSGREPELAELPGGNAGC
jgi:hypothetical protein